jgi:hypothetical protein
VILDEQYEWSDVRFEISGRTAFDVGRSTNRQMSYDVSLSFADRPRPRKEKLPAKTVLYRLDFPVVLGIFAKAWWMKEDAFHRIFEAGNENSRALRREWQNNLAMPKPRKGRGGKFGGRTGEAALRTQVFAIVTTEPVFAWVGTASPLFHKDGGEVQVYLPNLARGSGPYRSNYAHLHRTYTLPAL